MSVRVRPPASVSHIELTLYGFFYVYVVNTTRRQPLQKKLPDKTLNRTFPGVKQLKGTHATIRHYFIDEAGDSTLFSAKGKVLIGTEGCSRFFMLGLLDVPNPMELQRSFDDLRGRLMNDSYFRDVPSMQEKARKTALAFHANNDLPEVRREVFRLLRDMEGLGFSAVVADKWRALEYVRQRNETNPNYRYHPNDLYDYLIPRLFKERLHQCRKYNTIFSKRGKSDRASALRQGLEKARDDFAERQNIVGDVSLKVSVATPKQHAGLQAVDYFVWALQRLYERGEDRYVKYLWRAFRLVQDIDDRRAAGYGVYYTQKKPLDAAALEWRVENKELGI